MGREGSAAAAKSTQARARWKAEALLEELKELAGRLGLEVREERLLREVGYHVRSGTCRMREQNLILIDRDLPAPNRLEILLDVLSTRELGDVYVSPELRRMLGREDPA